MRPAHSATLALLAVFTAIPAGTAHSEGIAITPSKGTAETHFAVSAIGGHCSCTEIHSVSFSLGGFSLQGPSGTPVRNSFSLDTTYVSYFGVPAPFPRAAGTYTIEADWYSECSEPEESCGIYQHLTGQLTIRAHPPVLLIHGICANNTVWGTFAAALEDSGFDVEAFGYATGDGLRPRAYVSALTDRLESMASDHVAVVAHSMGGIIAREYMREQFGSGNAQRISQLITIGTPHHGSDFLQHCLGVSTALDVACAAQPFGTPCHIASSLLLALLLPCQTSSGTRNALLDLVPTSPRLSQLNYGPFVRGLLHLDPLPIDSH